MDWAVTVNRAPLQDQRTMAKSPLDASDTEAELPEPPLARAGPEKSEHLPHELHPCTRPVAEPRR